MRQTLKKRFNIWKYRGTEVICAQRLQEFVEIPPDTERIDIVFYEHPGKNRLKVTLPTFKYNNVTIDGESVMLYSDTHNFLFRYFKKNQTVYVGFEY